MVLGERDDSLSRLSLPLLDRRTPPQGKGRTRGSKDGQCAPPTEEESDADDKVLGPFSRGRVADALFRSDVCVKGTDRVNHGVTQNLTLN